VVGSSSAESPKSYRFWFCASERLQLSAIKCGLVERCVPDLGFLSEHSITNCLPSLRLFCFVCIPMTKPTQRVRTRSVRDVTVNTRVTKETRDRARTAASALGWLPADVYREAFGWWLDCFDAAGGRQPSDIERAAALASIRLAHTRISDALSAAPTK